VQQTYVDAVQAGKLTPEILLTEAGIRTLVAMAGVSKTTSTMGTAAPQSGLARSYPDGSRLFNDGTVQLNARQTDEGSTLEDRMRRAVEKSIT
jgi:hypothetical protein